MKIMSQKQVDRLDSVQAHNELIKHDSLIILYHCGTSEECITHTQVRDARYRISVMMG